MKPIGRNRLRVCLVVAAASLTLAGCGGAAARFASHLQRGKDYLAAGNLDKASVEFRNASQIQPKNPTPLYFNGRVAEARGNIREAVGFYQAAVDADAGNEAARAGLGKMLAFAGAAKRALDVIAPGLKAHPDNADLLAVRAAAHHQLKENEAALADAERAVQLAPANENAVAVLAGLYAEAKDYAKAIALVRPAVDKAPASIDLREVLTNLYLVSGQPALAQEQMRQVIALRPLDLTPRSQLALYLARAHDLDGAQRVLEEAVQVLSKDKQQARGDPAKLLLVDFIATERSREQGEKTLRGFIAQDPDNLDLRLGLGALLQRTGAGPEAIAAYQEVVKRDGTGAKALVARDRMAAIEISQGKKDDARKLIAEVLQKSPRDDDALTLRANLELEQNDPADAIGDLRAVLRDQPGSIPLQLTLARAYAAKGQPALAEETLRAVMQAAPNDISVRMELAQLFARTDRVTEGVTLLQETLSRVPDNIQVREALIKIYLQKRDLAAARAAADELKSRQPNSAVGFYYVGLLAAQEKHLEEAQKNLERAHDLQPHLWDVLIALLKVQTARGSYDAAIGTVQAAIGQDSNNARLLELLGGLYLQEKDFVRAADAFTRESAKDAHSWQAHRNLATVKLAVNDPAGAASEYQAALQLGPVEPQLVLEAARFYEKQGRIDDAIQAYDRLYKGNPPTQQFAANNLAMLLVTYKTDRASLDRARDLTLPFANSDNGSLLDTAGWVHFKRGEYRDALPTLERALEKTPDSRVIRYHLGMDELQLGLRDRARDSLESAVAGSDNFEGVEEARTVLARLKARA